MFYPTTLKSQWYLIDVCDSIARSLEGAKHWMSSKYESEIERAAYIETFEQCQLIVKNNDLRPDAMLQALSNLHTVVTEHPTVEPFFSKARWIYKPNQAREQAIILAFNIVEGISDRFLS